MKTIAIIDYGMCNLDSVRRAIEECGGDPVVTDREEDLERATHIILPGVGSFRDGMGNLKQRSLDRLLRDQVVGRQIPFLGICLGMQMLAVKGWEGGETEGLGWIEGEVKRLEPAGEDRKIPHVGWNEVTVLKDSRLFEGIGSGTDFYFVHSYQFACQRDDDMIARTAYCGGFVSAVERGCVFGVQFHPEKSQRVGFHLLRNFLAL